MVRKIATVVAITIAGLSPTRDARAVPVLFPGNGNYYELISIQTTWANARTLAATYSHLGVTGHLATITSGAEDSFIATTFATGQPAAFAWIAGHEPGDNGVWLWGAGPESGVQFSQSGAATAPYNYVNWSGVEPNDFAPGEDFAAINLGATFASVPPGAWIDSPNPNPSDPIFGFIVEYEAPATGVGPARTVPLVALSASPNPIVTTGTLHIDLARPAQVDVALYDVTGRRIRTLARGTATNAGRASLPSMRDRSPSGVYFARVTGTWRDGTAGPVEAVGRIIVTR